jgi:hypothetical protein
MRVLGLALAGGLVVTVSLAAHAAPPGSNMARLATGAFPDIVQVAVVGAGIRCPDIGASGEGDGFRRIVRRTATTGAGTLMWVGKAPMEDGVMTAVGEVRTGVGVGPTAAHNPQLVEVPAIAAWFSLPSTTGACSGP